MHTSKGNAEGHELRLQNEMVFQDKGSNDVKFIYFTE